MKSATGSSFLFHIILKRVLLFLSCVCVFFFTFMKVIFKTKWIILARRLPYRSKRAYFHGFDWKGEWKQHLCAKRQLPKNGRSGLPSRRGRWVEEGYRPNYWWGFFYRINVLLCLKGGLDVWQFFSTLILSLSWDGNDKSTEKKPLYYKRLDEAIHFFVKVAFPLILFRPEKGYFSRKINVSCSEFTIL